MKKAGFIFDLDDTIYDRSIPFGRAVEQVLGYPLSGDVRSWYHTYSICSQEMFEAHVRGEITLEESHILRIRKAMQCFQIPFSKEQEPAFQKAYSQEQGRIEMSQTMKEILDFCAGEKVCMGVITNGPVEHQMKKRKTLGLEKWIPEEHYLISDGIGYTKPDEGAFRCAEKAFKLSAGQLYMIGDSYSSDICGAARAGWKTIWLNKDHDTVPENGIEPDYMASSEEELKKLLINLIETAEEDKDE